jgi:hypothetical protein
MNRKDLTTGLVLIAIGLVFLAGNLDLGIRLDIGRLWPLILIGIGGSKLLFPGDGVRASGLPLLLIGSIFLAHNYRVISLRQSWPLFIVAAGLSVLVSSWCERPSSDPGPGGAR